jgi:hypothetical protein
MQTNNSKNPGKTHFESECFQRRSCRYTQQCSYLSLSWCFLLLRNKRNDQHMHCWQSLHVRLDIYKRLWTCMIPHPRLCAHDSCAYTNVVFGIDIKDSKKKKIRFIKSLTIYDITHSVSFGTPAANPHIIGTCHIITCLVAFSLNRSQSKLTCLVAGSSRIEKLSLPLQPAFSIKI